MCYLGLNQTDWKDNREILNVSEPSEIILGNLLALLQENFQDRLKGPRMSIMSKGQWNKNQKEKNVNIS